MWGMGEVLRQRGPIFGWEIRRLVAAKVTRCFEEVDSFTRMESRISEPLQLVSAGQGRKRLTHRVRSSSALLRGACVPRRR